MSDPIGVKGNCPKCGEEFAIAVTTEFREETMTIAYKLEPGRFMVVEDFCTSLGALAKSLKLVAKELGTKAIVGIRDLSVSEQEVTATVIVLENRDPKKKHEKGVTNDR